MTIKINLLQNKKDYVKLDNGFRILRVATVSIGILILVTLLLLFALQRNISKALAVAEDQREVLLQNIVTLQDRESRIIFIQKKVDSMKAIINDSTDYSYYMETLFAVLDKATIGSSTNVLVEDVAITENNAVVTLRFANFEDVSKFITKVESDEFLDVFDEIRTNPLQISDLGATDVINLNVTIKKPEKN